MATLISGFISSRTKTRRDLAKILPYSKQLLSSYFWVFFFRTGPYCEEDPEVAGGQLCALLGQGYVTSQLSRS
jgi:hypothetical protein